MELSASEKEFARRYAAITENPEYLRLRDIPRHGCTNTYDHSVRVAYLMWRMAHRLHIDPDSAARVGLLHDFCLINYRAREQKPADKRWYCFYHPEDAVDNALRYYTLSGKEQRAILSHMFPLSSHVPSSRIAVLLTLADKQVASKEAAASSAEMARRVRMRIVRSLA